MKNKSRKKSRENERNFDRKEKKVKKGSSSKDTPANILDSTFSAGKAAETIQDHEKELMTGG